MSNINPEIPAGASGATFSQHGGAPHAPRIARDVAAAEAVGSSGFLVQRPQVSEMSPDALVATANRRLAQRTARLEFVVRHDPAGVVVRLIDVESGDVIRQYSTSEVFEYAVSGSVKPGRLFYAAA